MKKIISLSMAALLAISLLSGCDELPGSSNGNGGSQPSNSVFTPPDDGSFSVDLSVGEYEEGGDYGYLGDVMNTYFMNFAIDQTYTCASYGSYTAPEGKQLLVVRLGVKNTMLSSLPMYDIDFQVQWNDDSDDAYAWPITTDEPWTNQVQVDSQLSDEQLPPSYELPVNGSQSGELVFEVPADIKDFSVSFQEIFEDDTTGDVYFVYFTAEPQA